jgi:hypothetical protein
MRDRPFASWARRRLRADYAPTAQPAVRDYRRAVRHEARHAAVATTLAAVLAVNGCAPEPVAEPPPPATATSPPNTLAKVDVGDALTVTATVDQVIDERALVVRDVDLADRTLLVLAPQAVEAAPPQLLRIEGTVVRFSYRSLAARHQLTDHTAYRPFEGQKALVASQVTVWR